MSLKKPCEVIQMSRKSRASREYAVYRGDKFDRIGTGRECAEYLGVDVRTVAWYSSQNYRNRMEQRGTEDYIITVDLDKIPDEDEEHHIRRRGRPKINLSPVDYAAMKQRGMKEYEIANAIKVNKKTLYEWKQRNKEEIEKEMKVQA